MIRRPWPALILWAALWAGAHVLEHGWSWHFLRAGARALVSGHPLSLYALHPELQMGPLAFVAAAPFSLLLPEQPGEILALIAMTGIGLLALREIRTLTGASRHAPERNRRWFLASLVILPVWAEVAVHWGHLDDALALLAALIGLRLLRTGHPIAAAVLFALAVDCKPWAVPLAALLLLAPRRRWLPVALVWGVVVAAAWAPFILGDPQTLTALRFAIPIDPASTLRLFGTPGDSTPGWDRYVQLGGAFALAAVAVWKKRWAGAFLIVFAVRMLLDPATKNYYDVGLVIGAGIFDISLALTVVPWLSIAAVLLVYLPSYALMGLTTERSILRTVVLGLLVVAVFVLPLTRWYRLPSSADAAEPAEVRRAAR
ncbi:hypothetical protein B7R21_09130 [Subtercola boreus]|uniref:DUF2029 domain-containing protein n=2 Tax=Subtercola boreus TaxID=120213 RepID=A0A3E0VUC6_9MICO|nr:hypothetical protein B7R21_09130 [Subtercola boreus]